MSYVESYPSRIAAKRLKRRREIAKRVKAYGSPYNHATIFGTKRRVFLPPVMRIESRDGKPSLMRRIINWFKSLFI